jgi:hypothetical protein
MLAAVARMESKGHASRRGPLGTPVIMGKWPAAGSAAPLGECNAAMAV